MLSVLARVHSVSHPCMLPQIEYMDEIHYRKLDCAPTKGMSAVLARITYSISATGLAYPTIQAF